MTYWAKEMIWIFGADRWTRQIKDILGGPCGPKKLLYFPFKAMNGKDLIHSPSANRVQPASAREAIQVGLVGPVNIN